MREDTSSSFVGVRKNELCNLLDDSLVLIYRVSQKNVLTLRMTRKPLFMNIERNKIASNT